MTGYSTGVALWSSLWGLRDGHPSFRDWRASGNVSYATHRANNHKLKGAIRFAQAMMQSSFEKLADKTSF